MSVRITAQTRDFESGVDSAQRSLGSLSVDALEASGALQILGGRADEAGDEVSQLGRRSLFTSGAVTSLGLSSEGAGIGVTFLSNALIVSLLPALTTILGALTPVVAALGGLATIGAAFGGIGLVGFLAAVSTEGERLKESAMGVFETFQDVFAPAIELASAVIEILLDDLEDILPALLPSQEALQNIAGIFAELGGVIIDALPAFSELAVTLVREFGRGLIDLVDGVLSDLPDLLRDLVDVAVRVSPLFAAFGAELGRLLPELLEFGFAVLPAVARALGTLSDLTIQGLQAFNSLDSGIQGLLATSSLLAPVLIGITSLIGGISAPILAAIAAIGVFAQAYRTNFANVRTLINNFAQRIQALLGDRIPELVDAARRAFETWRPVLEPIFNFVTKALATLAETGLDFVLSGLTAILQVLGGDFTGAWETAVGLVGRQINRLATFLNDLTSGAFETFVNGIIRGLNFLGQKFDDFLTMIGQGDRFDFEAIEQVNIADQTAATAGMQQNQQEREIKVSVEANDQFIRDVTVEELRGKERRRQRNTGRNTNPVR